MTKTIIFNVKKYEFVLNNALLKFKVPFYDIMVLKFMNYLINNSRNHIINVKIITR